MYLVGSVPTLLFVVSRWFIPESPKWLAAQVRPSVCVCVCTYACMCPRLHYRLLTLCAAAY